MANFISSLTGQQLNDALTQVNQRVPEGWAVGERDGIPVSSSSPYYQNNAKYYAEQAGQAIQDGIAEAAAEADRAEDAANRAEAAVPAGTAGAVFFDRDMHLSEADKARARNNIGTDKPSENKTASGDIVSFTDGSATPVKSLKATLDIDQDLNGYAYPWPAGGGKNLIRYPYASADGTYGGLTFSSAADGTLIVTGTISSSVVFQMATGLQLPAGQYTLSASDTGGLNVGVYDETAAAVVGNAPLTFTADPTHTYRVRITRSTQGLVVNATIRAQLEAGATATSWVPYSNVCPITPHTAVNITRAGKNLLPFEMYQSSTNVVRLGMNTSAIKYTYLKAGTYTLSVISGPTAAIYINYDDGTRLNLGNGTVTFTVENNSRVFFHVYNRNGITPADIASFQLEIGSTATAYTPYNGTQYLINIGINQWDEEWEVGRYSTSTGEPTTSTGIRSKNFILVDPSKPLYISTPTNIFILEYAEDGTFLRYVNYFSDKVYTPNADARKIKFYQVDITTYGNDISINYPSSVTDYYPYTGRQVYGGELDVTTGVLIARYGMVDMGTLTYNVGGGGTQFYTTITDASNSPANNDAYCSNYPRTTIVSGWGDLTDKHFALYNKAVRVYDTSYSTAADFKTAMAGVQLLYELATPLTIQLTPTEVQTLTGTNNVWADSGAVNVSYWTEGLVEADNLNAVLDSKKVVYASPHTYNYEEAKIARGNIGAGSNRNLLDNPFFQVNQRGQTTVTNSGTAIYFVDRWKIGRAEAIVESNSIKYKWLNTGTAAFLIQYTGIDAFNALKGKTVTLSVSINGTVYSNTFTAPTDASGNISNRGLGEGVRFNFVVDTNGRGYELQIHHTVSNDYITIASVKLELGSVSTLANDAPPNYQQELAKCQWYFERIKLVGGGGIFIAGDTAISATSCFMTIKTRLRDAPVAITYNSIALNDNANGYPITSVTVNGYGSGYVRFSCTASGLTTNKYYKLAIGTGGYIDLSAEL